MNKFLTESGWKAVALKSKLKDNGLQKALAVYENLNDEKSAERLKAISAVSERATALNKSKEIEAAPEAAKYLTNLLATVQPEQRAIAQARDQAEKKAQAEAKKQEQKEQAGKPEDEDEEEGTGDSYGKLAKALQTLKTSKVPYYFLFCKDKPYGLVVSKRDITKSAQHKKELAKMAGGSTSPPKFGQCHRDGSKLIFEMDKPVPGMARVLQKWIKDSTGLGLKVMVGNESADDEDAALVAQQSKEKGADLPPMPPALEKAPEIWHQTRRNIEANINGLKAAIRKEFAEESPDIIGEIEQNMNKLDRIFDKLDDKLANSLDRARAAKDAAMRQTELTNAKSLLKDYIKYVNSEQMIAHIDSNPFVKTNLKQTLNNSLLQMGKALG